MLETAAEFAKGRIITVFGCGGDRDNKKRPIMGEIAGRMSQYCVITSDNPRTEDPEAIIDEVENGAPFKSKKLYVTMIKYIAPVFIIMIFISSVLKGLGMMDF